jgi:hypothetical protein
MVDWGEALLGKKQASSLHRLLLNLAVC